MGPYYWNDWYAGWGWLLWFGFVFLLIMSLGNWGYTRSAHRKFGDVRFDKEALDLLNERYARGEIMRDEYLRMKADLRADFEAPPPPVEKPAEKKPSKAA